MNNKISFVCIDKRSVDHKTNQTYILLESGSKVILPPNIHSVPSLLLVNKNYKVILGDDIIKHYHPQIKMSTDNAVGFNGEPAAYQLGTSSGGSNIVSEQFTSYNMTPEELSGKGYGGNRQLYNYVSANDDISLIPTPPDTYRPDKLSNSVTIDTLQQQRMDEISKVMPNQPFLGSSGI